MKTPRGISESSTTSDNTTEFIDIVKKYDIVYNTHNPDYKNAEVKLKIWSQIAEEIGLSVDASKRKWKNLRDSYTKYLRSFRTGTKTSKKYQYWAHADHMDFLKPYQGPGRNTSTQEKVKSERDDTEDTECDLGYQVLTKASTTSSEEELKIPASSNNAPSVPATTTAVQAIATIPPTLNSTTTTSSAASVLNNLNMNNTPLALTSNTITSTSMQSALSAAQAAAAALALLPLPTLPTVQLPPTAGLPPPTKHQQLISALSAAPLSTSVFPLPQLATNGKSQLALPLPISTSAASNVGCLIIEPQLFSDSFKKELSAPALGLVNSFTSQTTSTATTSRINPPLISKIRRVQPSPQTAAINLSFSANTNNTSSSTSSVATASGSNNNNSNGCQPPPAKQRKTQSERSSGDIDVAAILQANRDLDANTLFFLSLARTVRAMPTKFQSLAKMRCMRIVSDIELELDNMDCTDENGVNMNGNMKYGNDSPSPPAANIAQHAVNAAGGAGINEAGTEHFVYVMSPSRVESMIDLSSDEDATNNGV